MSLLSIRDFEHTNLQTQVASFRILASSHPTHLYGLLIILVAISPVGLVAQSLDLSTSRPIVALILPAS